MMSSNKTMYYFAAAWMSRHGASRQYEDAVILKITFTLIDTGDTNNAESASVSIRITFDERVLNLM